MVLVDHQQTQELCHYVALLRNQILTAEKTLAVHLCCLLEITFRVDLKEIGREVVDWIDLAQDRDKWRTLPCPEIT
jgi:hypothetical protein